LLRKQEITKKVVLQNRYQQWARPNMSKLNNNISIDLVVTRGLHIYSHQHWSSLQKGKLNKKQTQRERVS